MLKEEQGELQELEERLSGPGGLGASMNDATGELSAYDNHPGDYGSEMHERSKDLGLLQMTRKQIAEIEEAQESIRDGNYGSAAIAGRRYPKTSPGFTSHPVVRQVPAPTGRQRHKPSSGGRRAAGAPLWPHLHRR